MNDSRFQSSIKVPADPICTDHSPGLKRHPFASRF